MNAVILTPAQARKIIIHAAGLAKRAQFGKGREAVYKLIEHLGYIQIDANYVVERAHHHMIRARVPDYKPEWLTELEEEGQIFEFFTSDTGYQPMYNFRFSLPIKESYAERRASYTQSELNLMNQILDRVGRDGPLTVKDFDNDREVASTGWWDWRPSKIALERLYMDGQLMVTRKKDFQKLYDLPRNLVSTDIDTTMPTPEEFARHVILRELKAQGITSATEIAWRARRAKDNLIKKELEKMADEGVICRVEIEGRKMKPHYMLPVYKKKKIELAEEAFILSPFDILNVFRRRLKEFFDFDYQIECFVPEPKRKYGYFSLPVLIGDTFVARMDAKADRKKRTLAIHNLHFEEVKLSEAMLEKLSDAIKAFAQFNQCREIVLTKTNHKKYGKAIKDGL